MSRFGILPVIVGGALVAVALAWYADLRPDDAPTGDTDRGDREPAAEPGPAIAPTAGS